MVLWEIADRRSPFDELWDRPDFLKNSGINIQKAKQAIISDGLRPTIPPNCPYSSIMLHCWRKIPSERPSAAQVASDITHILDGLIKEELTATVTQKVKSSARVVLTPCGALDIPSTASCIASSSSGDILWTACDDRRVLVVDPHKHIVSMSLPVWSEGTSWLAPKGRRSLFCAGGSGGLLRVVVPMDLSSAPSLKQVSTASKGSENVLCIALVSASARDCVWIGSNNGLQGCFEISVHDALTLEFIDHITFDLEHPVMTMTQDIKSGLVWVGTAAHIALVDPDKLIVRRTLSWTQDTTTDPGCCVAISMTGDKAWSLIHHGRAGSQVAVWDCPTEQMNGIINGLKEPVALCVSETPLSTIVFCVASDAKSLVTAAYSLDQSEGGSNIRVFLEPTPLPIPQGMSTCARCATCIDGMLAIGTTSSLIFFKQQDIPAEASPQIEPLYL